VNFKRVPPPLTALINITNANTHQITDFKQTWSEAVVRLWFPSQASIHDDDDDDDEDDDNTSMAGTQTFTYSTS
jgi:hypothetical protein